MPFQLVTRGGRDETLFHTLAWNLESYAIEVKEERDQLLATEERVVQMEDKKKPQKKQLEGCLFCSRLPSNSEKGRGLSLSRAG